MLDESLAGQRWNREYQNGRYQGEAPLPFVKQIIEQVKENSVTQGGKGLYVGCGNGRNYLPLVDAGLDIDGVDLSSEAIAQLVERRALLAERLICGDFRHFYAPHRFTFIVAIQVFQHGSEADVAHYFEKVTELLLPDGLFCLRVNSISTQIYHSHQILERNQFDGFTVKYLSGPKQGIPVHFYSLAELENLTQNNCRLVALPREVITQRSAPQTGSWAQWEAIWQKR